MYNVDIVMPGSETDAFNESRAGFSHEYGHTVLCSLMWHGVGADDGGVEDRYRFEWAWQDMIVQTAASFTVEKDAVWIKEGFADFLASQVAGGVHYFFPGSISHHRFTTTGSGTKMCDVAFDDCMEDNDLQAPAALRCVWPDRDLLRCFWEDASLDGEGFDVSVADQATGQPFHTDTLAYSVYATTDVPVGADPEVVVVSIATLQAGGDISGAAVAVLQRPPPPILVGCGNGVVEPCEQCDGAGMAGGGHTCPPGCAAVRHCIACQLVADCECN